MNSSAYCTYYDEGLEQLVLRVLGLHVVGAQLLFHTVLHVRLEYVVVLKTEDKRW